MATSSMLLPRDNHFSAETIHLLKEIQENFPTVAQSIFEDTYLIPFNSKIIKDNLHTGNVERISHGAQHASRVAAYVLVLVNFFKKLGYPKQIVEMTQEQVTLLQLTALFHDSARKNDGVDVSEAESAAKFKKWLRLQGFTDKVVFEFADYIIHNKEDFFYKIFQSADALDIMRVKENLQLEMVSVFDLLEEKDKEDFYALAREVRFLIAGQYDLKLPCAISLYGEEIFAAIPPTRDATNPHLKAQYEHASNCYLKVTEDFNREGPLLNQYFNNNHVYKVKHNREESIFLSGRQHLTKDKNGYLVSFETFDKAQCCLIGIKGLVPFAMRKELLAAKVIKTDEFPDRPYRFRLSINQYKYLLLIENAKGYKEDILYVLYATIRIKEHTKENRIDLKIANKVLATDCLRKMRAFFPNNYAAELSSDKIFSDKNGDIYLSLSTKAYAWLEQAFHFVSVRNRLEDDYYIKTIRTDEFDFYEQKFLPGIVRMPQQPDFDMRLRPKAKKEYTVRGDGVYKRSKKPSTYTAAEKQDYSQIQSFSLATGEFVPEIFVHNTTNPLVVGVIISAKDILLSERLYIYDGGTVSRPFDKNNKQDAQTYFLKKRNDKVLFSKNELEEFKHAIQLNSDLYNEAMVRARWNKDGSSFIVFFTNTLEARLIAQMRARLLKEKLRQQAAETGEKWDESYEVPICYYKRYLPQYLVPYNKLIQYDDRQEAMDIYANSRSRERKYAKNRFEFLLALSDTSSILSEKNKNNELIFPKICKQKHFYLIEHILDSASNQAKKTMKPLDDDLLLDFLVSAAKMGRKKIIEFYLTYYPAPRKYEKEILVAAVEANFNDILKLPGFDDVNLIKNYYALFKAAVKNENLEAMDILDQHYATNGDNKVNLYADLKFSGSILSVAAANGYARVCKMILDRSKYFSTREEFLKIVNYQDDHGNTALMLAAKNGFREVVELLISLGANASCSDMHGNTALILATKSKSKGCVKSLLTANCRISKVNEDGISALSLSQENNLDDIQSHLVVENLIKRTNRKITNESTKDLSKTFVHLVKRGKHKLLRNLLNHVTEDEIKYFLNKKISLNDGWFSPTYNIFFGAISLGNNKVISLLLDVGADLNSKYLNHTPLLWAIQCGNLKVVKLILEKAPLLKEQSQGAILKAFESDQIEIAFYLFKQNLPINWEDPNFVQVIKNSKRMDVTLLIIIMQLKAYLNKLEQREDEYKPKLYGFFGKGISKQHKILAAKDVLSAVRRKYDSLSPALSFSESADAAEATYPSSALLGGKLGEIVSNIPKNVLDNMKSHNTKKI